MARLRRRDRAEVVRKSAEVVQKTQQNQMRKLCGGCGTMVAKSLKSFAEVLRNFTPPKGGFFRAPLQGAA